MTSFHIVASRSRLCVLAAILSLGLVGSSATVRADDKADGERESLIAQVGKDAKAAAADAKAVDEKLARLCEKIAKAAGGQTTVKVPAKLADLKVEPISIAKTGKNAIIVGQKLELTAAVGCVILAEGDVSITNADGCIIIAAGNVEVTNARGVLILAGKNTDIALAKDCTLCGLGTLDLNTAKDCIFVNFKEHDVGLSKDCKTVTLPKGP